MRLKRNPSNHRRNPGSPIEPSQAPAASGTRQGPDTLVLSKIGDATPAPSMRQRPTTWHAQDGLTHEIPIVDPAAPLLPRHVSVPVSAPTKPATARHTDPVATWYPKPGADAEFPDADVEVPPSRGRRSRGRAVVAGLRREAPPEADRELLAAHSRVTAALAPQMSAGMRALREADAFARQSDARLAASMQRIDEWCFGAEATLTEQERDIRALKATLDGHELARRAYVAGDKLPVSTDTMAAGMFEAAKMHAELTTMLAADGMDAPTQILPAVIA